MPFRALGEPGQGRDRRLAEVEGGSDDAPEILAMGGVDLLHVHRRPGGGNGAVSAHELHPAALLDQAFALEPAFQLRRLGVVDDMDERPGDLVVAVERRDVGDGLALRRRLDPEADDPIDQEMPITRRHHDQGPVDDLVTEVQGIEPVCGLAEIDKGGKLDVLDAAVLRIHGSPRFRSVRRRSYPKPFRSTTAG